MVALGTLLIVLGGLAIAAAIFVSEGTAEILGFELNAMTLFLLGVTSGVAILFGFSLTKAGTMRTMRERRERKKIDELSTKLEAAKAERRLEGEEQ